MNEELEIFLKDKTIKEAAKQLGVSRQTIYNWIKKVHSFSYKNWKKIVDFK